MWKYLFSLEERRYWWLKWVKEGPLKDYLEVPFPELDADWRTVEYLALDLETTGLDHKTDQILSFGHVVIRHGTMQLEECDHYLVKPKGPLNEDSVVVHGITDDQSERGMDLEEALARFLKAMAGRVMIAHHATIEMNFIDKACREVFGHGLTVPVVDTFNLEERMLRIRDDSPKPGQLRLASVRQRYGLPRYRAHNALIDAIAAGELFLAQAAHRAGDEELRLKNVLAPS